MAIFGDEAFHNRKAFLAPGIGGLTIRLSCYSNRPCSITAVTLSCSHIQLSTPNFSLHNTQNIRHMVMRKCELIKQSKLLKIETKILSILFNEKYGLKQGEFNNTTGTERVNCRFSPEVLAAMLVSLNKRILIISFVWDTNMAAMSIVFCISWDSVKTKNIKSCVFN